MLVGMLAAHKKSKRRATRLRDPERTRERLLQAASREIYRSGFQSASLGTILASAGVTKGALYHHFKNKEALGYAVVEEIISADVRGHDLFDHRISQGFLVFAVVVQRSLGDAGGGQNCVQACTLEARSVDFARCRPQQTLPGALRITQPGRC